MTLHHLDKFLHSGRAQTHIHLLPVLYVTYTVIASQNLSPNFTMNQTQDNTVR